MALSLEEDVAAIPANSMISFTFPHLFAQLAATYFIYM